MPDPGTGQPSQHQTVTIQSPQLSPPAYLLPPIIPQKALPTHKDEDDDEEEADTDRGPGRGQAAMPASGAKSEVGDAEREAEENRQKAKQLPCRYCQKRFRRLEHVQRHERTHTKEKPFMCGCGKTFGRRDLLVRHEKLVHLNEANNTRDGEHGAHSHVGARRASVPIPMKAQAPQAQAHLSPQQSHSGNSAAIPNLIDPDLLAQQNGYQMGGMHRQESGVGGAMQQRLPCSLDLLSDAATHIASTSGGNGGHHQLPSIMQMEHENDGKRARTESFTSRHQDEAMGRSLQAYHQQGSGQGGGAENGLLGDYNILLDDFGISSHVFPPIDTEVGNLWGRPEQATHSFGGYPDPTRESNQFAQQESQFGRYPSRISHQSEYPDPSNGVGGINEGRAGPPWKISSQDHRYIQSKLDDFAAVLPKTFELPSRHTLSRFLEGYVNGFNEHVPFLHIPTVQIVNLAPELILALAAIGANYRFEGHRGNGLWYASRAVAVEQARRRASSSVMEILSPSATYKEESSGGFSPPSTARNPSVAEISGMSRNGSEGIGIDQFSNTPEARLETIQALFLLVAVGTWSSRTLLRESLTVRSYLALLVQECGLSNPPTSTPGLSWEAWIKAESEKRTKCLIYCFFNLHCIAYDIPPLIVSTKMEITLPQTAREWRAATAWEWAEIRRQNPPVEVKFLDALTTLFAKPGTVLQKSLPATSSLGNYMLITAISQQIFFLRQTASISVPGLPKNGLKESDIEDISNALKSWQASWERTPESSLDPTGPNGPVAFNSTALLRFAFIRLHSDLGPSKYLETRDPVKIARGFLEHPPLQRGQSGPGTSSTQGGRVGRAVLQAAHALSIPIKIGVQFVARTQTFSWSIQHSLCNLECAFLLSKWLETIAVTPLDLTPEERSLLDMVKTMLDETEYAVPWSDNATPSGPSDPNSSLDPPLDPGLAAASQHNRQEHTQDNYNGATQGQGQRQERMERRELERREAGKIRALGAAVVRLWAETFRGTQIFDIVKAMGMSLEIYGGLLREGAGV